jgi:hypothetical protein
LFNERCYDDQASFIVFSDSLLNISERRLIDLVTTLRRENKYINPKGQAQHVVNSPPSLMPSDEGLAYQLARESITASASPTPDNTSGVNSANLSCLFAFDTGVFVFESGRISVTRKRIKTRRNNRGKMIKRPPTLMMLRNSNIPAPAPYSNVRAR